MMVKVNMLVSYCIDILDFFVGMSISWADGEMATPCTNPPVLGFTVCLFTCRVAASRFVLWLGEESY